MLLAIIYLQISDDTVPWKDGKVKVIFAGRLSFLGAVSSGICKQIAKNLKYMYHRIKFYEYLHIHYILHHNNVIFRLYQTMPCRSHYLQKMT